MNVASRRGYVSAVVWLAATAGSALVAGLAVHSHSASEGVLNHELAMSAPRLDPALTYHGQQSCTGSGCHSGEAKKQSGRMVGDENTIWEEKDPHAKAFKTLTNDKSKKIADTMKLGDASKAAKCLDCHAMDAAKKGEKLKDLAKEGVSCESCHGASEKWKDPHQKAGWTDEQRKAIGAAGLKDKFGLIDTNDLAVRASMCVSCHLKIDKDMVDAGHPELDFEMYSYNNYKFLEKYQVHWDDADHPDPSNARAARMWAIGQVAAAASAEENKKGWGGDPRAEAMAKLFGSGKEAVKAAFGSDDIAALNKADLPKAKISAAADAVVAMADGYKSGKEFKHQRSVIASGLEALATAAAGGKDLPDAVLDAVEAAQKEEGDAWIAALKKIAAAAK
ncbi:MAG: multiheme c-type cytochrome [Phycisphaerales bacterium]